MEEKAYLGTKMEEENVFLDQFRHLKKIVKENSIPTLPNFFQTVAIHTDFVFTLNALP